MTEQREPHAGDEAESTRPDTGNWRPVPSDAEPDVNRGDGSFSVQPADAEPDVNRGDGSFSVQPADAEVEPDPEVVEPSEPDAPVDVNRGDGSFSVHPAAEVEPDPEAGEPSEPDAPVAEEPVEAPVEPATEPTEAGADATEPDGSEATEVIEDEKTTLEPLPIIGDQPVAPMESTESIFRPPSPTTASPEPEPTHIEQLSEEEQKLAAERSARREARVAALTATAPMPLVTPDPVIVHKRTNDKFWGSLGLFLLRIVVAAIFAVRGMNLLTDIPAAQQQFGETVIPEPGIMAIVTGVACLLIALSLVLGLLTRLAGIGIVLIAGGALAFVLWGPWSPFVPGQPGFVGEFELLLATVGLVFVLIGAGGWSLDRSFRAGRERDKAERSAASDE